MIGGQGHENVGVRRSNRGRVTVGKIDAAVRQANVVNDVVDFARRNLLSNRLFDLITKIGCFFNAHSGGSTQMKLKSAAVHTGEEVLAQPGKENYERAQTASEERNEEHAPMMQTKFKHPAIAFAEFLECFLKSLLESDQRITNSSALALSFLSTQQVLSHSRNDGPRKEIRGQHSENHCFSERYKEVPRHAGQ